MVKQIELCELWKGMNYGDTQRLMIICIPQSCISRQFMYNLSIIFEIWFSFYEKYLFRD